MLIDLSEILSTEGQVKDYDVISELKEFSFNGNVYVVDNVKDFILPPEMKVREKQVLRAAVLSHLRCYVTVVWMKLQRILKWT